MGKIQMSRGKTIKLSTTLFFFCSQSLEVVGEVISLGWERYGGQIRIWEVTHFLKTCFWILGQLNAGKCIPKQFCTHAFHSTPILTHVEALSHSRKGVDLSPS